MQRMTSRLCRRPTSKSLGSWAGVIFTAPVPKPSSTYSSATMGISRFMMGRMHVLPTRCLNRSSSGFTATPVSPIMVSGRVVATTRSPLPSARG